MHDLSSIRPRDAHHPHEYGPFSYLLNPVLEREAGKTGSVGA